MLAVFDISPLISMVYFSVYFETWMFSVQPVLYFLCRVIHYDGSSQFYVESPWRGLAEWG